MKKTFTILTFAYVFSNAQVLNHQTAINGAAERSLQFKVTDAPNDVMEIGNSTAQNNQFQPTIWVHKESSAGPAMVLSGNITTNVDNGIVPIINIVAGKDVFDNSAPYGSQFPWGAGGTTQKIVNRPVFAVSNAFTRLLTVSAEGNFGFGTTNPLSKLHNVGTVRFENLPTVTYGCTLLINGITGEVGVNTNCLRGLGRSLNPEDKKPILDALNTIKNVETYQFVDEENNVQRSLNIEKTQLLDADYQTLIPYLLESIKELNAKIEELENKINKENSLPKDNFSAKIYPNPVKDNLNIYIENSKSIYAQIRIFDNTGKLLVQKSENLKGNKVSINISNFNTGIYLYDIVNSEGKQIKAGKFIKE